MPKPSPDPRPPAPGPEAPWLKSVTFHGLLASLTPLIPLPLLDDWAAQWVESRQVRDTFRRHGVTAEAWHVEVLLWDGKEGSRQGCLAPIKFALKLGLYVLKRSFRKLLVFLLLKDCADRFSTSFHHGYLLHRAFERGAIDRRVLAGGERLIEVRQAMLLTCEAVDPRPFNQLVKRVLASSKRVLLEAARTFGRLLRAERKQGRPGPSGGAGAAAEEALGGSGTAFGGLIERLSAAVWGDEGYRAELERVFGVALARQSEAAGEEPPVVRSPPA